MINNNASKTLLQALKLYGLYCLDNELPKSLVYLCLTAIDVHKKLAHISYKALKCLLKHSMIQGIQLNSIGEKMTCDACIKAKVTHKPIPKKSGKRAKKLGEKVYSDAWGCLDIKQSTRSHSMSLLQMTTQMNQLST